MKADGYNALVINGANVGCEISRFHPYFIFACNTDYEPFYEKSGEV